jgi:ATP-dependent Clp protease protease subunit
MARRRIDRDDVDKLHDCGLHIPTRTVYLGDIEREHVLEFTKNLRLLDSTSQEPITICINSAGGCVDLGLAVIDAIRACRSPVTGMVEANAESMAIIILQACDERVAYPNSLLMAHTGTDELPEMPGREAKSRWLFEQKLNARADAYLIEHSKKKHSKKKWQELLDAGIYMTGTDALEWGWLDRLVEVE